MAILGCHRTQDGRIVRESRSDPRLYICRSARAPSMQPGPRNPLGGVIGGLDVRRRLFLALGAVEFQNRVERDFAHALLDGKFFLVAVLLLVLPRAKLPDHLNVRALLQGGSKGREFSPGDCPMPVGARLVIALVGSFPRLRVAGVGRSASWRVTGPCGWPCSWLCDPQLCCRESNSHEADWERKVAMSVNEAKRSKWIRLERRRQ